MRNVENQSFFVGQRGFEGNQQQFWADKPNPQIRSRREAWISGMRSKGDKSFAAGRKTPGSKFRSPIPLRVEKRKTIFRQLKTLFWAHRDRILPNITLIIELVKSAA